ncbi:MAG: 30S ribosomal protein S11 [Patescibacteria group bacterium]
MGKKRIIEKAEKVEGEKVEAPKVSSKRKVAVGILHVQSTFNNTKLLVTDTDGNALLFSSSGALGFRGAKKGTPYAAAKVGELLADKAVALGISEIAVVVKGVGSGRESSIRAFATKGIGISSIRDVTPVAHNGPRAKKPRRV